MIVKNTLCEELNHSICNLIDIKTNKTQHSFVDAIYRRMLLLVPTRGDVVRVYTFELFYLLVTTDERKDIREWNYTVSEKFLKLKYTAPAFYLNTFLKCLSRRIV